LRRVTEGVSSLQHPHDGRRQRVGSEVVVRRDRHDGVVDEQHELAVRAVQSPRGARPGPAGEGVAVVLLSLSGRHPLGVHGVDPSLADQSPTLPAAPVADQSSDASQLLGA
jgi:hypothetical protein